MTRVNINVLVSIRKVTDLVTICMDKFLITLRKEAVPGIDLVSKTIKLLSHLGEHHYKDFSYYTGKIENLKVNVSNHRIKIGNASLCKFYKGNNFENLSRNEVADACKKLEDVIQLPLKHAIVNSFEFGRNIVTKHNPLLYFDHLGNLKNYQRSIIKDSIYYHHRDLSVFTAYDKLKESIENGQCKIKPPSHNLMRLEKRYLKGLAKYFKKDIIELSLFKNTDFYSQIIYDWYEDYKNIEKIRIVKPDFTNIKTKTDLINFMVLQYLSEYGVTKISDEILFAFKSNFITKKQKFDMNKYLKEVCSNDILTIQNDLIIELDTLIKHQMEELL